LIKVGEHANTYGVQPSVTSSSTEAANGQRTGGSGNDMLTERTAVIASSIRQQLFTGDTITEVDLTKRLSLRMLRSPASTSALRASPTT
jgi:hypothetical protein